jgi:glycine oxidase
MRKKNPDAVVCGAGVIGCSIARELAGEGLEVVVLDRGRIGSEASGAAAGLLSPQVHFREPGPMASLCLRSRELYPAFVAGVEEESQLPAGLRLCGSLRVVGPEEERAEWEALFSWQKSAGLAVSWADAPRLAERTAGRLSNAFSAGIEFGAEGVVDNRALVAAIAKSARKRGVLFLEETPALGLRISGNRCTGVKIGNGEIEAGAVVDAAGAWAGFEPSLPFPVPIRPARGQIVELEATIPLACPVYGREIYVAPRSGGRLALGSTVELVGFEKRVTAEGVSSLLSRALRLFPGLAEAEVTGVWSGFRPMSSDGLPILGGTPLAGFFLAAGHFRDGILLAPETARIMAAVILGRSGEVEIGPFRADRFPSRAAAPASA